ncbi:MAG: hypothetical protein LBN98_03600 [Prevotellaceae bacterium]|jgi:hypothetical protein|nr:hypothetical protein [Prevotellaceae bacterium]
MKTSTYIFLANFFLACKNQEIRTVIPPYRRNDEIQEKNFARLAVLKREKKYEEAFALIDVIEAEGTYDLRKKFILYMRVNKERSILFRKLKNKPLLNYYYVISELGAMINAIYFSGIHELYMFENFYFTDKFILSDNDRIKSKIYEYVEWFKPLVYELNGIHKEIKKEHENTYLDYQYIDSRDLDIYLYEKNQQFIDIGKKIECNMPHHFIDKSLFF